MYVYYWSSHTRSNSYGWDVADYGDMLVDGYMYVNEAIWMVPGTVSVDD